VVAADINWTKTVNVVERIAVEKALFIKARPNDLLARNAVEGFVFASSGHTRNTYIGEGDAGSSHESRIADAIHDNAGLINVNVDSGAMNNQGNLVALGETDRPAAVADSQVEAAQHIAVNVLTVIGGAQFDDSGALVFQVRRTSILTDAVHSQTGATGLNQTSGRMNSQTNALSLSTALGIPGVAALSESALGQSSRDNRAEVSGVRYEDVVTGAVHTNSGVTQVNQSSGSLNTQASAVAFSGVLSFTPADATSRGSNLNLSKSDCCRY